MEWIILSIGAYFLLAIESVADKFLISGKVKNWRVYLFYIGILSLFSLFLAPFGLAWPGKNIFFLAVVSGGLIFLYLAVLFSTLKNWPATRVFVLSGASTTVATLLFSHLFLEEVFSPFDLVGVSFLVFGGFFIAYKHYKGRLFGGWKQSVLAGVLAAGSYVLMKHCYQEFPGHNFITIYVSSRVGLVAATLLFFLFFPGRKELCRLFEKDCSRKKQAKYFSATIVVKSLAGIAALIISHSISVGSVTIVNALSSVQYLFVFLLSIILGFYYRQVFHENLQGRNTFYKSVGVVLVIIGVILVTI